MNRFVLLKYPDIKNPTNLITETFTNDSPFFFRKCKASLYPCLHMFFITWGEEEQPVCIFRLFEQTVLNEVCVCVCVCVCHLRVGWEQRSGDSVEVGQCELNGGVGEAQLMNVGWADVSRADVTFSWERRHRDGVFQLVLRQIISDATVHVPLRDKTQRQSYLHLYPFKWII